MIGLTISMVTNERMNGVNMSNFEPCPSCGSLNLKLYTTEGGYGHAKHGVIKCLDCGLEMRVDSKPLDYYAATDWRESRSAAAEDAKRLAIEAWNNRKPLIL